MEDYLGFEEIQLDSDGVNNLYRPDNQASVGCLLNEYIIANDTNGAFIGLFKNKGNRIVRVPFKTIKSKFLGTIKPRNIQQQMALDMLYDADTTVNILTGKFGTGKDYLMCAAATDLLERNKFDKIVYVRNNIEVKDSKPIGFLPGSYNEKMMPFAGPLADHLGGIEGLNMLISRGQLEIVHLGFLRGRDIKNSIIICSEAENMTKEHIQLLIGRVGEGSVLWINGDFKQCDSAVFERNSGLMTAVHKLQGNPLFGYVRLLKTERSETAALADLLD